MVCALIILILRIKLLLFAFFLFCLVFYCSFYNLKIIQSSNEALDDFITKHQSFYVKIYNESCFSEPVQILNYIYANSCTVFPFLKVQGVDFNCSDDNFGCLTSARKISEFDISFFEILLTVVFITWSLYFVFSIIASIIDPRRGYGRI